MKRFGDKEERETARKEGKKEQVRHIERENERQAVGIFLSPFWMFNVFRPAKSSHAGMWRVLYFV